MGKRTVHLVYSVPRSSNIVRRAVDKGINVSGFLPPLYRTSNDLFIPWRKPIRAPHSISYHLLHALKDKANVRYYSLYEKRTIELKDDDVLIGVPAQEPGPLPWKRPDESTVMVRTLKKYPKHKHTYLLMPYSNDPYFMRWADDLVREYGKRLLLLSGKIWFDEWNKSPWSHYAIERKIRLTMGVNVEDYPQIKTSFNPKGRRGFLYIGHTSWYKNIAQLEKIAVALPEYTFGHVGLGTIPGWKQIADFADLNEEFMTALAKDYDCFVNVSCDAQVTTVLEQMCFGMYVACTPESGYEYDTLMRLDMNNTDHNVEQLKAFQSMDETELRNTTQRNRQIVEEKHTWKQFCDDVLTFVNL